MTQSEQKAYWRKYATQNAKMERLAAEIMYKAIRASLRVIIAHVQDLGRERVIAELDGLIPNKIIKQAYNDIYYQVGVLQKAWADQDVKFRFPGKKEDDRWRRRRPKPQIPIPDVVTPELVDAGFIVGFFNPAWLARLKSIVNGLDVAQRVASVSDTIKKQIKKSLEESVGQFSSFRKIAKKLRDDVGGEFSIQRAKVVARTEVTNVANLAAEQSAMETGLTLVKVWIHTLDDRTRDTHRNVSTKPIKSYDKFNVGGYMMDKPGDSSAPIREVINCRCIVSYLPADDYEDLGF